jgi:hypothetical protein
MSIVAALLVVVLIFVVYRVRHVDDEGNLTLSGNMEVTEMNLGFKAARDGSSSVSQARDNA